MIELEYKVMEDGMKNKKGFTLVELLAVIVILALIMSIAIVSIGGVLQSTRQSTIKETAASIIDGVQKQLLINNRLEAGYFTFGEALLEKGGKDSPLGGTIVYNTTGSGTRIGNSSVYKESGALTCNGSQSFVHVIFDDSMSTGGKFTYTICLSAGAGEYYIDNASYDDLLNNSKTDMFKKAATS